MRRDCLSLLKRQQIAWRCLFKWVTASVYVFTVFLELFSYDLEMKTREQNRNNTSREIERFYWFIEWIQTRVSFGRLSKRSGEKPSCPRTFRKSVDTSLWRHTKTRWANRTWSSPHLLGFYLAGKRRVYVLIFDKTSNEHLPKPFFGVKGKSLYRSKFSNKTMHWTTIFKRSFMQL